MFKLLIVDDEPLAREGIRCSISWRKYGFTIVGEAADGMEALAKIAELQPDCVLTDMSMSVMDGVSLIHNIIKDYPLIQIVILTAYNDFIYTKTAIDCHIFAYISKPALNEEIISVFCRLREKMEQDIRIKNDLDSYYSHQMDQQLTQLLYTPKPTHAEIAQFIQQLHGISGKEDYYIAAIEISTESHSDFHISAKALSLALDERIDYYLSISENRGIKAKLSLRERVLLIFTQSHDFRYQTSILQSIQSDFQELTKTALTIGVSATFRNLTGIHRAYMQALEALSQKSQFGSGSLIDYMSIGELCQKTPVLSGAQIQVIVRSVLMADSASVTDALNRFFDSLKDYSIDITAVRSNMTQLITTSIQKVFSNMDTLNLLFKNGIRPATDFNAFDTIAEIQAYTNRFFEKVLLYMEYMGSLQPRPGQYSSVINNAISYIITNYAKEIKIPDIASHLYMSESHLMHSFKKETGKTFNSFLAEYRVHLAAFLIQSGSYKLYEVSELVGYKNPLTFRKAFTKIMGDTPSGYKL